MAEPVDVTRGGQSYCDWCLGELSPASVRASEELGLHAEFAWACDSCLRRRTYAKPPNGWDSDPGDWPFGGGKST